MDDGRDDEAQVRDDETPVIQLGVERPTDGRDDVRDADGNLIGLRPVELVGVTEVDRRHARGVFAGFGLPTRPYAPEIDDGMMDDHLRRLVDRANVQVRDQQAGTRKVPDAWSNAIAGAAMLEEDEGLRERARELDEAIGGPAK